MTGKPISFVTFLPMMILWILGGVLPAQGPPPGRGPVSGIHLTPDTVYFTKAGNETSLTQTVQVRQMGPPSASPLSVATAVTSISGGNWLGVSPLSGGALTLTATPGSLAAGLYEARVTVTPSGSGATAQTIAAFLRIIGVPGGPGGPGGPSGSGGPGAGPGFMVRPSALTFRMTTGGANPPTNNLHVSSPGGGASFPWTASRTITTPPGGSWLQIANTSGTGNGHLQVAANGSGLAVGQYAGIITVGSGSSSVPVPVTLEVTSQGSTSGQEARALVISPAAFNFIVLPGAPPPAPKTLRIRTTRSTPVNWTAAVVPAGCNWLSVTPASGATPASPPTGGTVWATTQLAVTPGSLARGSYECSVKVTGGGATETARVFLRILGPPAATPTSGVSGTTGSSAVQITPPVIEFSSTGGTVSPASVTVRLNSRVSGLTFASIASTAQGGAWMNITSPSNTIPGTILVTATAGSLTPGIYTGLITVNIAGSVTEQRLILVTFRVTPPGATPHLIARPAAVAFQATRGGANPAAAQVSLEARGAASIPYQATLSTASGGPWLAVSPATGTAPQSLTVNVNITGLAAGRYTGEAVFQATGSPGAIPATLQVVLTVMAPRGAAVAAAETGLFGLFLDPPADFSATANSPEAVRVMLIDASGNPVDGAEVTVTSSGDEPPFTLEPSGDGTYTGVFRSLRGGPVSLTAAAATDGGTPVDFATGGDVEGAAQPAPLIFQEGIVSSANFAPGATPLAPGSILSLFGRNLTASTLAASALPLPRQLGGVKVLVAGLEAPLVSVAAGQDFDQINFQAPVELAALNRADVVVSNNGVLSNPEGISIAPGVPGIFTSNQQGTGSAAALHADFALVTPARPARSGETILLFATGLGAVQPASRTGEPAGTLAAVSGEVEVRIGGRPAAVPFAGLAPGFVGLYQINVTVPVGAAPGDAAVEVTVDGISAGEGVVVPVG